MKWGPNRLPYSAMLSELHPNGLGPHTSVVLAKKLLQQLIELSNAGEFPETTLVRHPPDQIHSFRWDWASDMDGRCALENLRERTQSVGRI